MPQSRIQFRYGPETTVKKGQVADIRTFKIQKQAAACMRFYKSINQGMRGAECFSIGMISHKDIAGTSVRKKENTGSH